MSSQAKCWMYDEASLNECREQACSYIEHHQSNGSTVSRTTGTGTRVRKFASGYYSRKKSNNGVDNRTRLCPIPISAINPMVTISQRDQETLVHFHAHQIQKIIGPNAIFPLLKRGSSVLSTAIMLFRKFYLSNSVVDFHPRNIAAASALLAVKTDCERNIPIDLLSHATFMVEMRAQNDPLCRDELRGVTVDEIEDAERTLLEGCDYRLRCHHPYGAIKVLVSDVLSFFEESQFSLDDSVHHVVDSARIGNSHDKNCDVGESSPRSVMHEQQPCHYDDDHVDYHQYESGLSTLCERALSVAQTSLVYSDINFLYPPGQIAFAAVSLALDGHSTTTTRQTGSTTNRNRLGAKMRKYLCSRFSQKSSNELLEYETQVSKIITNLEGSPVIDLEMFSPFWHCYQRRYAKTAERQAIEIRRAIFAKSRLRVMREAVFQPAMTYISPSPPPSPPPIPLDYHYPLQHHQQHHLHSHDACDESRHRRKRDRNEEYAPNTWTRPHHKIARVTPINIPFI